MNIILALSTCQSPQNPGPKVQNEVAAQARAARLAQIAHQNSPDMHKEELDYCSIDVNSDSDDDCGYAGGVNVVDLESDEPDFDLSESEWSDNDSESLVEMEGDELAANLHTLKAYWSGLGTCNAQALVQKFSSTRYKSHTGGFQRQLQELLISVCTSA